MIQKMEPPMVTHPLARHLSEIKAAVIATVGGRIVSINNFFSKRQNPFGQLTDERHSEGRHGHELCSCLSISQALNNRGCEICHLNTKEES